jgi:N-acetylglucosaminyl-diphospho-decaprenol L-rhamnosyltransferase
VPELAVIVVSNNQASWLPRCLESLRAHAGGLDLDVVVVDNGTTRESRDLVERDHGWARVLVCPNRGFGHANNQGLATVDAPWILFLNPDTEFREGTLEALVGELERRPRVGLAGVRQIGPDGALLPTMRRFPSVTRALGDALGLERLPGRPGWLGERETRLDRYDGTFEADWTIGSFMLARREAVERVGGFDERFFVYSEEVDFCLRVRAAGWTVAHVPLVTILHHGSSVRTLDPRMSRQNAYAQLQFAGKHFSAPARAGYRAALLLRYALRSLPVGDPRGRAAARAAAALVLRGGAGPFGPAAA